MARPRYAEGDERAVERLEAAFWEMLAEMPYGKISVRGLIARSGLNKNTFYYHFEGMGALATWCVDRALPVELGRVAFAGGGEGEFVGALASEAVQAKLGRVSLLLSENGSALHSLAVSRLVAAWEGMLPALDADAAENRRLQLGFAAGGLVATLAGVGPENYAATIARLRRSSAIGALVGGLAGMSG